MRWLLLAGVACFALCAGYVATDPAQGDGWAVNDATGNLTALRNSSSAATLTPAGVFQVNQCNTAEIDNLTGDEVVLLNESPINNTEQPTPTTVSAYLQIKTPPHANAGATETAAIYIKNEMTASPVNQFVNGIYIEQDEDQSLVGGAGIKCVHRGDGDCIYVAHLGNSASSFGYESAMFGGWQDSPTNSISKQENGFMFMILVVLLILLLKKVK